MGNLESDLQALNNGIYKDQFVKKLIAEAKRDRHSLLRTVQDEFEDYFERTGAAGMVFHKQLGKDAVRHSIVSVHKFPNRPTYGSMWTEQIRLETRQATGETVTCVDVDTLALSGHGLAFRVGRRSVRSHNSGLKVATQSIVPPNRFARGYKGELADGFIRDFAGAPEYLSNTPYIDLIEVHKSLYRPLGMLMSLGADTETDSVPEQFEGRLEALAAA